MSRIYRAIAYDRNNNPLIIRLIFTNDEKEDARTIRIKFEKKLLKSPSLYKSIFRIECNEIRG